MTLRYHWESQRLFFLESLKNLWGVASFVPSSRQLANAMLRPIDFTNARTIVEFGAGTGSITRQILNRMHRQATLYSFELNPVFCAHIRRHVTDSRLVMIEDSAEALLQYLNRSNIKKVDAVVSSLGLTCMSPETRENILSAAVESLKPSGVFTQFQYLTNYFSFWNPTTHRLQFYTIEGELQSNFERVDRRQIFWNFPPANIFACSNTGEQTGNLKPQQHHSDRRIDA